MAQSPQANTRFHGLELAAALLQNIEPVTKDTAGNVTYTAEEISRGFILRDPNGGARSDVFPTAATLYTELGKPEAGSSFKLIIRNTADAAETITMNTATGLTLSGTMTIAQNNTKIFMGVFTSPSAVTIYSIGTLVH